MESQITIDETAPLYVPLATDFPAHTREQEEKD